MSPALTSATTSSVTRRAPVCRTLLTDPVAEAVAAALAEAEAAHAAALAAAAERHAADLAEARLRWAADEGRSLAEGFRAAIAALEEALAEGAGAVLEPLIGEALRVAAVAELRRAIGDLVLCRHGRPHRGLGSGGPRRRPCRPRWPRPEPRAAALDFTPRRPPRSR